ncbi:beta-glucan synthesis-associated [Hyphopichia burtonii NRRL Y-1933]|uniref:Beta-glucan synthesis-associated n=1 Tax=Hyphopichia burtonii NRRL Y-1933 TaxID=984485 RepID=A0A1E4RH81_9ASCO|nr:beta-glucan synthesis-associated [Hyphopichia burtonii NRRL Y-1933]ODV66627.1 beta-glucan synthesis-associated [Hyphopichia burtonii NRRL Y-1933]
MAQRDLTYNSPSVAVDDYDDTNSNEPLNPFQESLSNSDLAHFRYTDRNVSELSNSNGNSDDDFNGYYNSQNNTTTNLLQPPANKTIPAYAPEFDRYLSRLGSRVVSSSSLVSQNQMEPTTKLLNENHDFSPFGGYPASSFPLHIDEKEPDDYLHNPDPIKDADYDKNRFWYDLKTMDKKSAGGFFGFLFLIICAIVVFILLPVLTYSGITNPYKPESYEILTQYLYPLIAGIRTSLVDPDTPQDALTHKNKDGKTWKLVFSDEFNADGRTFYEGDDQFFQAADLHYDATKDLEWYDPDAVQTANGTLNLRLDAIKNHDLFYRSGMVQSWNKMCFTQGLILASARLPNSGAVSGLWPGIWTMGNLGRPGYLSTTEGVWPYTYDSCDAGITANQSSPDGISYLPGQKLNSCTCNGEDHPNRGTGRGAPEIDIIEGEIDTTKYFGVASQSYQVAPYDVWYYPDYNFVEIHNPDVTCMNTYTGGPLQQAVSGTTTLNTEWYERGPGGSNFQVYGYEYLNDNEDGYITWYVGDETPTLTVQAYALAPNGNVGFRRISKEPMSIIMNLGISNNWAYIDWTSLNFPATMRIDYVRVYQPEDEVNLGCDPTDYPTYDYIENHINAYSNVNLTSWEDAGYTYPKNSLVNGC